MIISWEQIRQIVELFSENHLMIKRFYSDYEDQLSTYSTIGEDFPVLYMTPVDGVLGYTQNKLNIRFYCFDRIIRDRSNYNSIISDTQRCLNDLYKFLQSPNIELIDTELEASITPINDATMDYVAGWYMDIEVCLDTYSDCFIMIDGVPTFDWSGKIDFTKYLTCDTLEECSVIEDLQEEIENLTLSGLTDVSISDITTGEVIIYNGTEWTNQTIPTPVSTLSGLTDVSISDVTDGQALVFDGTEWVNQNVATSSEGAITYNLDGLTAVIIPNNDYPMLTVPFNCEIIDWSIVSDVVGSIEIDIWRANGTIPTVSDSIVGGNYIELITQQINSDTTLTGWTTNLIAGDILKFNVNSATLVTQITIVLKITK
jgi:hypothetical protein